MNLKKFFQIVAISLAACITILSGVIAAGHVISHEAEGENSGTEKTVGKRVNILLLALDKTEFLTDTIMLASFDKERSLVNIMSVPRDTRIRLNNSYGKINSAYALGEKGKRQELVIEKITGIIGLPIHYYVVVDPDGFVSIIDILGGVEIDVPQRMYYSDPTQKLYIDLKPGLQLLDGKKAEQFTRFRGYPEADLARIRAQQAFMKAIFEQKLKPEYLLKAGELYKEIQKYITTNVGLDDVLTLLPLIKMLNGESIQTYQLPGYATMIGDASYYIYNPAETEKLVNDVFLDLAEPTEEEE